MDSEIIIEKTAEFTAKFGDKFEGTLREKNKNDEKYQFLFPSNEKYEFYRTRVEFYANKKQEEKFIQQLVQNEKEEKGEFAKEETIQGKRPKSEASDPSLSQNTSHNAHSQKGQAEEEGSETKRKKTRWSKNSKWERADEADLLNPKPFHNTHAKPYSQNIAHQKPSWNTADPSFNLSPHSLQSNTTNPTATQKTSSASLIHNRGILLCFFFLHFLIPFLV
jgi:thiol:disulfide interchange protein